MVKVGEYEQQNGVTHKKQPFPFCQEHTVDQHYVIDIEDDEVEECRNPGVLQNEGELEVVVQRQQHWHYQYENTYRHVYKHFVQGGVVLNFLVVHNVPFFFAKLIQHIIQI